MVLNQLFISKPPIKLLRKIIKGFGINNLYDDTEFCYLDMIKLNTLSIFHNLENELIKYYIPCKQKIYFENIKNLTNKEAIVILRQLLKIHNYDLYSREKFIKGIKYSVYKIINKNYIAHEKVKEPVLLIDKKELKLIPVKEIEIVIEKEELVPENKDLVPEKKELVPENKDLVPENKDLEPEKAIIIIFD